MDTIDRDLDRFQEINYSDTEEQHEEELDQLYLSFSQHQFSQDQFIRFLDITKNSSWDIPSALGTICDHDGIYDLIPMHGLDWATAPSNDRYPNLRQYFANTKAAWEELIPHFKEQHKLDLTDDRINWSFDT